MRWSWLLALIVLGCAGEPVDLCTAAADHVASCTQEAATQEATTCDPDRAASILAMDCDELATAAAAGKADGWWDDFLCALGFTSHCPADAARTLTGTVHKLGEIQPIDLVLHVRAIRLADPGDVRGVWSVNGIFSIANLEPERYRVEVSAAATSAALTKQTIDLASQSHVTLYVPIP